MQLTDYPTISLRDVFEMAKPAKTVVEIGACNGSDTVRFLNSFGSGCKVFSVEPKPDNITAWKGRLKSNPRASLFEGVISGVDGEVDLYTSDSTYIGASSIKKPTAHLIELYPSMRFDGKTTTSSMTLETFCKRYKIGKIDLLWMDTQGAEADIIRSGQSIVNHNVKVLFIEVCREGIYEGQASLEELLDLLPNFKAIGHFQENLVLKNIARTL